MKKILALVICISLVFALFVGCNNNNNTNNNTKNNQSSKNNMNNKNNTSNDENNSSNETSSSINPAGEFPIVNEKIDLRVLAPMDSLVENYETNSFTIWYEDYTNIHVNWDLVPLDNIKTKVNLVLSSGDNPDILLGTNLTTAQIMNYGSQGIFAPLNSYIDDYGIGIKDLYKKYEILEDLLKMPDGNIYSMPDINDCYHCARSTKLWMYMPFLDALNLDVPETTEEYYQALKAIKENDPNGNGKADEIPLAGAITGWHTNIDGFFMNSFIYNDSETINGLRLFIDNGTVTPAYNKTEWQEGLKYLNKLYSEGLIAPESFSQQNKQLKQLGENPNDPILGSVTAGGFGNFVQQYGESGRWLEFKPIPPLEGPDGTRIADYDPYAAFNIGRFVIANQCENKEAAFRWGDAFYDFEITLRSKYGVPNEDWREANEGEVGINGKPALWAQILEFGVIQNKCWRETGISLRSDDFRLGSVSDPEKPLETILYEESKNDYQPYAVDSKMVLPPLIFDEDTMSELNELELTIVQYVEQMNVAFITGEANVENDWDSYIKELENMNLKRYIEIYQQAYDAKYK